MSEHIAGQEKESIETTSARWEKWDRKTDTADVYKALRQADKGMLTAELPAFLSPLVAPDVALRVLIRRIDKTVLKDNKQVFVLRGHNKKILGIAQADLGKERYYVESLWIAPGARGPLKRLRDLLQILRDEAKHQYQYIHFVAWKNNAKLNALYGRIAEVESTQGRVIRYRLPLDQTSES